MNDFEIEFGYSVKMGTKQSRNEEKLIDSMGQVNNNIVVKETVNVYSVEIIILLGIIAAILIFNCCAGLYKIHMKKIKRDCRADVPNPI